MILTIILLLLLAMGFWWGYHRGLLLTLLNLVGYVVIFVLAHFFTTPVGNFLAHLFTARNLTTAGNGVTTANNDQFFFNGIAFLLIVLIGWWLWHRLERVLNVVTHLPVLHGLNALFGGLLNLVIRFVILFLVLRIAILLPVDWIQTSYHNSEFAQWMVHETPILSEKLTTYWLH